MVRNLEELKKRYSFGSVSGKKGPGGPGHGPGRGRPTGKPKSSMGTIKRLLKYLSAYKLRFVFVFMCLITTTVTNLIGSYMLAPILDKVAGDTTGNSNFADKLINSLVGTFKPIVKMLISKDNVSETIAYVVTALVILGIMYIVAIACTYVQQKLLIGISQGAVQRIRNELFDKVQSLPLKYHDTTTTGETMSRFTNDVDNIGMMFDSTAVSLVSGAVTLIGTLFLMLYLNPLLTLITVVFIPVFTFGGGKIAKHSSKYYSAQQAALGSVNGYIEESVAGQKVIKVFNHEDECIEEFELLNNDLKEKQTNAMFYGGIMGPVMGNISKLSYAITAGVGGILCFLTVTGDIASASMLALTIGELTVFVQYANQFARPINEISMQMANIFSALAGAERVFRIMDLPEEPADAENAENFAEEGIKGHVILDNVSFGYNEEKTVLKNISLYAKPGQKIAFVGSTGAGKTTITNLLNRFYDINEGTITIDGVDIKNIEKDVLRKNIAMVLQDTHLFTGTVRENIRYGRLDATDEEVEQAAKTAYAHSFIRRLSKGYDTMIEGDGANLSQGQRQLLNIARAALSKAPILVLDEATSSVDTRTERHIERGMDALMEDRTTFVIAHRLSTVRNSNAIMVLEKGEIIERGDHDDLLAQKGRYYELYTGLKELD
ncbi:MAG: ABC transporter ATP-binding protein [Ruminococcaceae bacterium]|nr:ABC transporter ATP-binding protein [Oscillospiraceae bacterium]